MAQSSSHRFYIALALIVIFLRLRHYDHSESVQLHFNNHPRLELCMSFMNYVNLNDKLSVRKNSRRCAVLKTSACASGVMLAILILSGDIELNPGPECVTCYDPISVSESQNICSGCSKAIHRNCTYTIPMKSTMHCKSCFWMGVLRETPKCPCVGELKLLRQEIQQLRQNLSSNSNSNVSKTKTNLRSYADIVQQPSQRTVIGPKTNHPHRQRSLSLTLPVQPSKTNFNDRPNTSNTQFSQRIRQEAQVGQCRFTKLKASTIQPPPRVPTRSLFVNKLSLETVGGDIVDQIETMLGRKTTVKVSKLKSLNEKYYSSFHVEVPLEDFNEINMPMLWPVGCDIRPFRGRLLPFRIFGHEAREDMDTDRRPSKQTKLYSM